MRILLVSKYFYPENSPRSFRTSELAKELSSRGHEVTVYADSINSNSLLFANKHGLKLKALSNFRQREHSNSIVTKILRYSANKLFEYPDIIYLWHTIKTLNKEKEIQILITIGAPHSIHWGASIAKVMLKKFPRLWIADCGDPFMGNPIKKPYFYFGLFEWFFCKKVDYITIPIESARIGYKKKYHNKIYVIPQGFCFKEISKSKRIINPKRKPHFVYAGSVYKKGRNPTNFMNYLCELNIDFTFLVYTKNIDFFNQWKPKLGDKISIHNYVPRNEMLTKLLEVDFAINFENKSNVQVPSKLIDYAITDTPILSVILNDINTGEIKKFLDKNYSNRLKIPDVEQYNIINVASKFEKLMSR